jgi:tetratricopeptide (TPR) repeat protein
MAQAWQEWNQGSGEGNNQAIGLYRHVTEIAPDYADGWGLLACCYAAKAHFSPSAERDALRQRAVAAAREALRLDPRNAFGQAAIAFARPIRGNWLIMERGFRHALKDQPEKLLVHHGLGTCLFRVGRVAEAATEFEKLSDYQLVPFHFSTYIESLWAAGRLEEAERLSAQAATVYPTHPALWFQRFYMAIYGGRTGAAIAQAQNVANRPDDVDPAEYDRFVAVAQAIESRDRGQIDAVMTTQMRRARGSGFAARNAMQFASVLGRLDDAFTVADAYYFSRGFIVPDWGGAVAEGQSPNLDSRDTETLFLPSTRAMRADPRFDRLVEEIGLARYWRESGTQPDYRRT